MFLRDVRFHNWPKGKPANQFPFNLPAFQGVEQISFSHCVTFLVGENGSGKSTLLEAIAIVSGFNPEGGGRMNRFSTMGVGRGTGDANEVVESLTSAMDNDLHDHLKLSWLPKVTRGFFLRAESFFNFASYIDDLEREDPTGYTAYGGRSLHQQSHGESFLALFTNRFRSKEKALYLLDEPEAALSPARQLALLRILWEHEQSGQAQFIIATHSPILLGYPGAQILNFDASPLSPIQYTETDHYLITKQFLSNPQSMLNELLKP